jgi:hypothetical protein
MKLIYRGTTFDFNLHQSIVNHCFREPYTLRYRGMTYQVDPTTQQASYQQRVSCQLRYRGLTYFKCYDEQEKIARSSRVEDVTCSSQNESFVTQSKNSDVSVERQLVKVRS